MKAADVIFHEFERGRFMTFFKNFISLVAMWIWLSGVAFAQSDIHKNAYDILAKAQSGEIESSQAIDEIEKIPNVDSDPTLLTIHGSLLATAAAQASSFFTRMNYGNKSLELLEKAVELTPSDYSDFFTVYMTAALVNAAVPSFVGRGRYARKYFEAIATHPDFADLEAKNRAITYAWLARYAGVQTADGQNFADKARKADTKAAEEILAQE